MEELLKQIIKDQGKKQIKVIDDHGKQMVEFDALVKKTDYDIGNTLLLKGKEIYNKIFAEGNNEINTLNNKMHLLKKWQ